MTERKQINFTIVPDDTADLPRTYANFCAISHTPFDFTLAFCEVLPLSERDIQAAEAQHVVRAPVRSKIVVPLQVVPNLIAALQEHMRVYSESTGNTWDTKGPVHGRVPGTRYRSVPGTGRSGREVGQAQVGRRVPVGRVSAGLVTPFRNNQHKQRIERLAG